MKRVLAPIENYCLSIFHMVLLRPRSQVLNEQGNPIIFPVHAGDDHP